MTVSIRSVVATAFVLSLGVAAGPAGAQEDNEPLVIIPLGEPDNARSGSVTAESGSELEVEVLESVNAGAAGTLNADDGLGADLWRGSNARAVALLVPRIESGTGSQVMTDLARRLLLTSGALPLGDIGDFLGARTDRLIAIGRQDDVAGLVDSAGQRAMTPAAYQSEVELLLLRGDNDAACQVAQNALATGTDDGTAMTLVFCQRLAGQNAAADLGLAVLEDTGAQLDDRFMALDHGLASGQAVSLDSLAGADPLLFAMTLATGTTLDPALLDDAPAPIMRAAAMLDALPFETRLVAAERAVAAGTMDGATLGRLYSAASFNEEQIVNALSRADQTTGPLGRALLFQAAQRQTLPAAKAEALSSLLRHAARDDGQLGFLAASRGIAPDVIGIVAGSEVAWFSGDASMALLAAGEPEAAARWWPLLEDRARNDQVAAAQAAALWPIFRLAFGEQLADDGSRMATWRDARARIAPERLPEQTELFLALMAALDDRAAESLTVDALAAPATTQATAQQTSNAGERVALAAAARDGRVGDAVLLSLVLLGSDGPAGADPIVLGEVIEVLRAIDLGREARLLAMEAAFANAI